ncbi:MAG: hypothetical protein KTR31_14520 [Myxococcales bacterium]|nr:hypothetical protein [Myxococcales bacterium]
MRWAAWCAVACSGSTSSTPTTTDPCDAPAPATLEVGTGEGVFQALTDGDVLTFHAGPQGGHHVFVSLITTGLVPGTGDLRDPQDPMVTVQLTVDGSAITEFEDRARLLETTEAGDVLTGQIVVLAHPDPPALEGLDASLRVSVRDRCGTLVEDGRDVVLMEGDFDPTL